jgi:prepilin-type N-terminal cleavage/methylation domain-containing protein
LKVRPRGGFTLLEAVIALAIWAMLAAGLLFTWSHVSRTSLGVVAAQDAFENARAAMDALLMNIQLAEAIRVTTCPEHILRRMALTQRDPNGILRDYVFDFNVHAQPGETKHHRLEFGGNEFASQLAAVKAEHVGGRIQITITTNGESAPAITITGSADIRYKDVEIIRN